MRTWRRLSAVGAAAALLGGLGVVAAAPAQAAGTTLKLDRVHCIIETDEVGSDSPYVLVLATSPSNPNATRFGKWGPGGWDGTVSSGDAFSPNGTLATGVPAGWILWTVLMEEDNANDLSSGDLSYIRIAMENQWSASYWETGFAREVGMWTGFINAFAGTVENDDTVAFRTFPISGSSAGTTVNYTGDGGTYNLRFKLV